MKTKRKNRGRSKLKQKKNLNTSPCSNTTNKYTLDDGFEFVGESIVHREWKLCSNKGGTFIFFKFKILYFVFITYLEEEDDAQLLHRVLALICLVLVKLFLNYFFVAL